MEINFVKGDMVRHLGSEEHLDAYAHQCNCFCQMGRGIAPQLARAVPNLRKADNDTIVGNKKKMGTFTFSDHPNGARVYNVYGQYHWRKFQVAKGRNTHYPSLEKGLQVIKEDMLNEGKTTLGLPLIGCGLAGGDWKGVVLPMIEAVFQDSNIEITIFKL
uniref:Macro domain-containing protein n=1 Tax=Vibrio phage P018-4 TaxID=3229728 RepID=A0AB39AJP8_9CAUD